MQSHNNYVYTGKSIVFTVIPHECKSIEIFYMHIGLEILVVRDNEKNDPSTCALGEEKETEDIMLCYGIQMFVAIACTF